MIYVNEITNLGINFKPNHGLQGLYCGKNTYINKK